MTDDGDHWNNRVADRAGHSFFIESPEVFDPTSAAPDDDYVDPAVVTSAQRACVMIVKELNRADDLLRRTFALNPGRRKQNMNTARPSRNYIDDVANGGPPRPTHHPDPPSQERNCPLHCP